MDMLPWKPIPQAIDWPAALARHDSWIRKVVNARVVQAQDVDDVIQEISAAVLRQSTRPEDPQKVAPWLYGVAVRQASQFLRKRGQQERLLENYAAERPATEAALTNPRDWVMKRERQQGVRRALENLPPEEREILLLKYTEDLTYAQLAELLAISEKKVEHRLLNARNALRLQLQIQDRHD